MNIVSFLVPLCIIFSPLTQAAEYYDKRNTYETPVFVWNYAIIASCDVGWNKNPVECFSIPSIFDRNNYSDIRKGDIVWVKTCFLPSFCEQVLPNIKYPFILVVSVGDESFPSECGGPGFDLEKLLHNDSVIHIFAQNCTYSGISNKISHIPIGLDFHTVASKGNIGYWGEIGSPSQQENTLKDILNGLQPTHKRKRQAFVDFQLFDHMRHGDQKRYLQCGEDRTTIFNRLLPTGLIDYDEQASRSMLWKTKGKYAFSISPHGNGLDCHRTWEDLVLGCIVIVKTSALDPMYKGLPVVIIQDWFEITEKNMEKWLNQYKDAFKRQSYRKKLTTDYWIKKIKTVRNAYFKKERK